MRSKEFVMKDAYSFDTTEEGLDVSFNKMYDAYCRIFDRLKLNYSAVEADSGAIGGTGSKEFMVKSDVGEDDVVFCNSCGYAANVEKAPVVINKCSENEGLKALEKVETPHAKTIEDLVGFFNTTSDKFAKTLIYKADDMVVAVMVRGDREVNEIKVKNLLNVIDLELADEKTVQEATSAIVGFAGPIGIKADRLLVDAEVLNMTNMIVGANETGYHYINVNYERDFKGTVGDFRNITENDVCPKCGGKIEVKRGIEVGHIFKLGTKYSKAMNANFVDEKGEEHPIIMGCYGIGINRTIAAIIEQNHDEKGIIWPLSSAPYQVIIVPVQIKDELQRKTAEKIYDKLTKMGVEVLIDDRDERAGVKFNDADLIGIPVRITVGKKIKDNIVEFKLRRDKDLKEIKVDEITENVINFFKEEGVNL